jgi:uroporphyrinogen-III synthase
VDAVTFTSSPAVRNFMAIAEAEGRRTEVLTALAGRVLTACVGPVCAETAAAVGIEQAITPKRARLGTMVQALAAEMGGRARQMVLRGVDVTLQGGLAVVGDDEVRLTDRERSVLHALVDARGAVVGKPSLLRGVWGADAADEHVVEVTVSRLRRRLGAVGPAVQTVPRRGYRLA